MIIKNGKVKLIILALLISILSLSAFGLILGQKATGTRKSYKFNIDTSKEVTLDFGTAQIYVYEWDKNYVEVSVNNLAGDKILPEVTEKDNVITLINYQPKPVAVYRINTWISLLQFEKYRYQAIGEHDDTNGNKSDVNYIEIKIPKNIAVSLKAESVYGSVEMHR